MPYFCLYHITPRPLPPQGLFISSTTPNAHPEAHSIPGTIIHKHFGYPPSIAFPSTTDNNRTSQSIAKLSFFLLILLMLTFISSTHLPNTLLPIVITDAIGSSKFHGYALPILWDLIEPEVKRKAQLLLPR